MLSKIYLFSILLPAVIIMSCSKSNGGGNTIDCSGGTKTFSGDVNPIIQSTCATSIGCHSAGSTNGPGELISYQDVFDNRSAIRTAILNGRMPKTGSLSSSQKNAIICWIDSGAPNN